MNSTQTQTQTQTRTRTRARGVRAAAAILVACVMTCVATATLEGQEPAAPTPNDLMLMNRAGDWQRVVQLGERMLATPGMSTNARCETYAHVASALARLRQRRAAAAQGAAYGRDCSLLPAIHWTRAEVRRAMDFVTGDTSTVESRGPGRVDLGSTVELPPLPTTGVDFSSFDAFWRIADLLENDVDPTPSQWRAFWSTAGNRLMAQRGLTLDVMAEDMNAAFRPRNDAMPASVSSKVGELRLIRREHFRRARTLRPALMAFRDSLQHDPLVARALARVAPLLPAGATTAGTTPAIVFAMLGPDGYADRNAVILDLLLATETELVNFLGHEMHHSYMSRVAPLTIARWTGADAAIARRLAALWTEGTADMVDKTYPMTSPAPTLQPFTDRYNADYADARAIIARLDSLLSATAADSTRATATDAAAAAMLPFGGRAIGAYMARTVLETLGRDSLLLGVANPGVFLRLYAAAEQGRGNASPWSRATRVYLDRLSRRYWR